MPKWEIRFKFIKTEDLPLGDLSNFITASPMEMQFVDGCKLEATGISIVKLMKM